MNARIITLQRIPGRDGFITPLEAGREVPFTIRRVFYIHDIAGGAVRGEHANISLEEVVIALRGSCRVVLQDSLGKQEVWLERPEEALYIGPLTWKTFDSFSADCLLLVLASRAYDDKDHINDFEEFKRIAGT